jgi:hypothetical protein
MEQTIFETEEVKPLEVKAKKKEKKQTQELSL